MSARLGASLAAVRQVELCARVGRVGQVLGLVIEADGPEARLGELCRIDVGAGRPAITAEVVGFRDRRVLLLPHAEVVGIAPGCRIVATGRTATVAVGDGLLGRVVDALGQPLDGRPMPRPGVDRPLYADPLNPIRRQRVGPIFETGVRAIDGFLTVGSGQRVGLFAGSGVGKSALLGMIATQSRAEVNVIALIGERGREVREWVEIQLAQAMHRSVVVVATSEQSALLRSHAAFTATAIAEHFRDQGRSVCLLMDSVTRFAMARREIGLSIGEPATARGYTPSVFAALPRLLERAGPGAAGSGSITAFYTVLVEGDDFNEPISDHVRSILDGHFVLSRELASRGRFPALDLGRSISRLMTQLVNDGERQLIAEWTGMLAVHAQAKDLVELGAYRAGSNAELDRALRLVPRLEQGLRQSVGERASRPQTLALLRELLQP